MTCLATGGTADATRRLVESLGAHGRRIFFPHALSFLPGLARLERGPSIRLTRRVESTYSECGRLHKNLTVPGSRRDRARHRCSASSRPTSARKMKPLGDTFVNLVKMVIAPVVFLTIVLGIANMRDLKKVGRVGGKALLYFEIVTTFALGDRAPRRERHASRARGSPSAALAQARHLAVRHAGKGDDASSTS